MKDFGITEALQTLGIKKTNPGVSTGKKWLKSKGVLLESYSPVDGKLIGKVQSADDKAFAQVVAQSQKAFKEWRLVPAPKRGEVVRQIGIALRKYKEPLGKLVSYEMGKSYQEGLGEVQETIDIVRANNGQVVGVAILVDRSNGSVDFGAPLVSLIAMRIEAFEPDKLPPDLAAIPVCEAGQQVTSCVSYVCQRRFVCATASPTNAPAKNPRKHVTRFQCDSCGCLRSRGTIAAWNVANSV